MSNIRTITEQEAGKNWRKEVIWAEYGDPVPFVEALNELLLRYGLELVEVSVPVSDYPFMLRKKTTDKQESGGQS